MLDVFMLEDDVVTLESLRQRVEVNKDLRVVATASTLAAAAERLTEIDPDVMLVDLQLPDGESFDLIRECTDRNPNCPILIISVFGDESRVVKAISAGARGYLLKDDEDTKIGKAIRLVCEGQCPISPAIATHLIKHFQAPIRQDDNQSLLSERELEVLQLAAKGLSYREVSELLGVSISTIGTYTMRVYTKLAVNSRTEALFEARKLGLMHD